MKEARASAFYMEYLPREKRELTRTCHNRCQAQTAGKKSMDNGYREATHICWILGWPTPLCKQCAASWQAVWDGTPELEEVAA